MLGYQAFFVLQQASDMGTPALQRILALCEKLVTLIDGRYAGDSPGLMIENLVGDVRSDAEPGHA